MTKSPVIKSSLFFALVGAFASPLFAAPAEPPIVAAPPGVAIDFYRVSATRSKGGRFINTKTLPKVGYVAGAPALQVERLRAVKKTHTTVKKEIESADGKKRTIANEVPAIAMTLSSADATAFAELMKNSIGQRILIEAEGTPIYAPLVRDAHRATTLTFTLGDDQQLEEVYRKLARFVKK
ncbi:MAG: hypothetical protein ABIZ56_06435 [Chthoniobacteraceae bacterium]